MGRKLTCTTPPASAGVGIGWRRLCTLLELDHQGTVFVFSRFDVLVLTEVVVEVDQVVKSGEILSPSKGSEIISVHMVRHPRGSYITSPLLSLWIWSHQKTKESIRNCRSYARK